MTYIYPPANNWRVSFMLAEHTVIVSIQNTPHLSYMKTEIHFK